MALTRSFKELVKSRADCDPVFRVALLQEAVELFVHGQTDDGKAALRAYINATIGFQELGSALEKKPHSLMRMLGPAGNPTADNLFALIAFLQEHEGVTLNIATQPMAVNSIAPGGCRSRKRDERVWQINQSVFVMTGCTHR
ncbi:transcriptional regulator [Planctomicrobium sp. SH668]|uniref:transcriptional regulator n=1 Tax=Planctomicrobium sp. SH668 TaxID=3448126 RepID=UPI003F5CB314